MNATRRPLDRLMLGILAMALVARVGAAFYWQSLADVEDSLFRFGDSVSYWSVAHQYVGEGQPNDRLGIEGYSPLFRMPGYPLYLAPFAALSHATGARTAILAARLSGAVLGTLAVWLVYRGTLRLGELAGLSVPSPGVRLAARFAAMAAALYPGAIGMSVFILSEMIFCPLMLWALNMSADLLAVMTRSPQSIHVGDERGRHGVLTLSVAAGVLHGAIILTRPVWLLWGPFWAFYLLSWSLSADRSSSAAVARFTAAVRSTAVMAVAVVAVMLPWWWSGWRLTGHFVATNLQSGATLFDSFHDGASGGSDEDMQFTSDMAALIAMEHADEFRSPPGESDWQRRRRQAQFAYIVDSRLRAAAAFWVVQNPSDAAKLALLKSARVWQPLPRASQLGNTALRVAEAVGYVAILVAAAAGWWRLRRGWVVDVYLLPLIYFAVIHLFIVGSIRYRQPAILAASVLAGFGVAWLLSPWVRQRELIATTTGQTPSAAA